ncbi:MAG: DUF2845 domain-containing protein [Rhodanobacter sp.]
MRIRLIVVLFVFSAAVQASSSLRVGNQVLGVGDSAVRVTELLGKPSYKSRGHASRSGSSRSSSHKKAGGRRSRAPTATTRETAGEKWQYRRGDHVTIVTLVDGKVSNIEDERR